ncbi:hypothetical protein Skr01_24260 [Sphaerisporangium krabiense]|nr:hypothetical protein Skr01_24260 [Sphaerisporangium krabiense]
MNDGVTPIRVIKAVTTTFATVDSVSPSAMARPTSTAWDFQNWTYGPTESRYIGGDHRFSAAANALARLMPGKFTVPVDRHCATEVMPAGTSRRVGLTRGEKSGTGRDAARTGGHCALATDRAPSRTPMRLASGGASLE